MALHMKIIKGARRYFLPVAAVAIFGIAGLIANRAAWADSLDFNSVPFHDIASEILAGIGTAVVSDIPANGGYDRPRIKLLPPAAAKNGETEIQTDEIHAHMLAELTRQGSRTYRFVTTQGARAVPDGNVATNQNVADVLIVGTIHPSDNGLTIAYQAVSASDGLIFAATAPRYIRFIADSAQEPVTVSAEPAPNAAPTIALDHSNTAPRTHATRVVERTVVLVQRALFNLGYQTGPVDGVMRPRTRIAIREFQRDYNLAETGRITRQTVRALRRAVGNVGFASPYQYSGGNGDGR